MRADRRAAGPVRERTAGRRRGRRAVARATVLAAALVLMSVAPASAAPATGLPAAAAAAEGLPALPVVPAVTAGLDDLLVFPLLDCVAVSRDGSYRAVFGYVNTAGHTVDIPLGALNDAYPGGGEPTSFARGTVHGAYATPTTRGGRWPSWRLGGGYATAPPTVNTCGGDVTLPTEGNGMGPLIVILASLGLTGAAGAVRAWRLYRERGRAA